MTKDGHLSITKRVWSLIDEDPSFRKDLARGVINVSGLAEYLRKAYKLDGSLDAVVSAIRRYERSGEVVNLDAAVRKALTDAVVSTKNRVSAVRLKNSSNLYKHLAEVMKDPEFYKSEIFRLIKSRNETLVMIDSESLSRAKDLFPDANVASVTPGLAELTLSLTTSGWAAKGVMARLANEIANYGVNIIAVISAEPRISLFVKEEDLAKAHEAVLSLTRTK
jgi:hypothetical protein